MADALQRQIKEKGRLPGLKLIIQPLTSDRKTVELDTFISYSFQSSIIVPVDTFSFTFTSPTRERTSFLDYVQEGDVAVLKCETIQGERTLSTGIIDVVDIETTISGEIVTVQGRDFISQLEDQTCVNLNADPLPFGNYTIDQVMKYLLGNTRIKKYKIQNVSGTLSGYFAAEPGETKLSALLRYAESLNILIWSAPDGTLMIGKPKMQEASKGALIMDRDKKTSNIIGMKATRNSTSIPNVILPMWNGQEYVTARIAKDSAFSNVAEGAKRLARRGHVILRVISTSIPSGGDVTTQTQLTTLTQAQAGGSTFMQALAKREAARENMKELEVQALVYGHYNDDLEPFVSDSCYHAVYPSAKVDEKLYLYSVTYEISPDGGPRTRLNLCKLGTIVSDNGFNLVTQGIPKKVSPV